MGWKIEKWFKDVLPEDRKIFSTYDKLNSRELSILAASVLDLALAELISMRLIEIPNEQETFLGLDGDGRAPCGTFGSRIQLAQLLGIIDSEDVKVLRTIKKLRNLFAHKANADMIKGEALKCCH